MADQIRDLQTLDRLDAAQMTPEEFASYAIVIGVEPLPGVHLPQRMQIAAHFSGALQDLRAEIQRRLPTWRRGLSASDREQIEQRWIHSLLNVEIDTDAMCNRILGGRPLVLAWADLVDQRGRDAVAHAAHRSEIMQALAENRPAHADAISRYGLRRPSASAVEALLGVA